jgi:hypothetical protein
MNGRKVLNLVYPSLGCNSEPEKRTVLESTNYPVFPSSPVVVKCIDVLVSVNVSFAWLLTYLINSPMGARF